LHYFSFPLICSCNFFIADGPACDGHNIFYLIHATTKADHKIYGLEEDKTPRPCYLIHATTEADHKIYGLKDDKTPRPCSKSSLFVWLVVDTGLL
jgi:hypothetical protein